MNLTEQKISKVKGQAAFLPNQPILHGCVVYASETATLQPGDVVTLSSGGADASIVVKKAAVTDIPFGVVANNPIKTGWVAGERISIYPENSYVYMEAADASIARGTKVLFTTAGKITKTETATNAYLGITCQAGTSAGDLIAVQIKVGDVVPSSQG